ncbi:hypothetical protein [Bacillus sp. SJS]|uniref:hypothetical protein n=1 Tax=Bacillus sp. SJS TaxID=1423321 RepID=UPI0004DD2619|nr:hypothetical protein [Bacillus sp. SJS]KZZ83959.1 hypothetical protein AS29_012215 [Bacillus sp. SJS]
MKNRSRSYYRHQRRRSVNRKLMVMKHVWGSADRDEPVHPYLKHPGKLSKAKLNCSCTMCKYEKHFQIPKPAVKSKTDLMQQELKEYFL